MAHGSEHGRGLDRAAVRLRDRFQPGHTYTINGEEWGQTVYELQNWAYLSLFTIPVGEVLLGIWLAVLLIYLVIRFIRSRRTQSG